MAAGDDLILGFRFGVFFLAAGIIPNPLDIRFQKVSGLSAQVRTSPVVEGGQNLYTQQLPEHVDTPNLVLERGMLVGSPLKLEFNATMTFFRFTPSDVLVTLFGDDRVPLAAWMFMKAYPVRWATSDLSAAQGELVVETLELAYTRMQVLEI